MAEPKTKLTDVPVADFIESIADERVRDDCRTIAGIMQAATKTEPQMWGANIVGFGRYPYFNSSGKMTEWPLIAFSPRKQNLTLYILEGFEPDDELMAKLGKHSCTKGCLYIKRLSDIHLPTLKRLVQASVRNRGKKAKEMGHE